MFLWIDGQFNYEDILLLPVYLLFIYIIARYFTPKNNTLKKYYFRGLFLKILGGVLFWYIHCLLYSGGDSWAYFYSSKAIVNLILSDFNDGLGVLTTRIEGRDIYSAFNESTGFPAYYMTKDSNTFSVARFTSLFSFIGCKSFLLTTVLISSLSFIGIWKFYIVVNKIYPNIKKYSFYILLCTPSILFWSGGIMKDTFVFCSCCWFCFNFYMLFINKKKIFWNIFGMIINTLVILNLKSYVLMSLLPGTLIWLYSSSLQTVNSNLFKMFLGPVFAIILFFVGSFTLDSLSSSMGNYSNFDSAIEQAQIIQQDLLREDAYGDNNYYLGEIDGTFSGMLRLAPSAIFTALFRPLPWEIGSPTMVISALENSMLLIIVLSLLIRMNPFHFFRTILSDSFLTFAFIFSITLAFGVGIASTNFGALVRYKTPLIPFFFLGVYIVYNRRYEK